MEQGLIDSFARPGRNVTGRSDFAGVEVTLKRLQLLREAAPTTTAPFVDYGRDIPHNRFGRRIELRPMLEATAKDMGFETRFHDWSALQDIVAIFSDVTAWRAQAVTAGIGWAFDGRQRLAELALHHRLASAFIFRQVVEAGRTIFPMVLSSHRPSLQMPSEVLPGTSTGFFAARRLPISRSSGRIGTNLCST